MTRYIYIIFTVLLVLTSCKKAADRKCWKHAGPEETKVIQIASFNKLNIGAKLQVTLIQDTADYIEINGNRNLNEFVELKIEENTLFIDNKNKCDFYRKYKYKSIPVRLHFKDINEINFKGTDDLFTEGTIHTPELRLEIIDGSGTVNLNINVNRFSSLQGHGFGNYIVKGRCLNSSQIINSNGYCDASQLTVINELVAINKSQVDCKFNISNTQKANLQTTAGGSIYYYGVAQNMIKSELGSGKIIAIP